jgi:IclR family transcriptional regulator, blcABC operon repressor
MTRLVPSVRKAVQVLDLLAARGPGSLSLTAIAAGLDLPKSTALAICATLADSGMLTRDAGGCYRLGPHVTALVSGYLASTDPVLNLDEALSAVPELSDETIVVSVLDGADVVYIACRTGTQPIALQYRTGMRLPAHCAASGKALLSRLDEADVASRLSGADLRVRSTGSQRSLDGLLAELRKARQQGYAADNEEVARGMCCVGAAIGGNAGPAVAAVSVSWVKAAVGQQESAAHATAIVRLAGLLSANGAR